jgi:hypothetical protein
MFTNTAGKVLAYRADIHFCPVSFGNNLEKRRHSHYNQQDHYCTPLD